MHFILRIKNRNKIKLLVISYFCFVLFIIFNKFHTKIKITNKIKKKKTLKVVYFSSLHI
jgi:hypothetical protein